MSYETRILPPEEWGRLSDAIAGPLRHAHPINTRVVAVERDGVIVGTLIGFRVLHLHGLWIDEGYRHAPGIGRRLLLAASRIAKDWGVQAALTEAPTAAAHPVLTKLGAHPGYGPTFIVPLGGEE